MVAGEIGNTERQQEQGQMVTAHVTYLEMHHQPTRSVPHPSKPKLAVMRAEEIPADFYRYMYSRVGKLHHWYERRKLSSAELYSIINDENTHIDILYADGCPAGFFELDVSKLPDEVQLVYFGLIPNYQGIGLGKWFLSAAVHAAWEYSPKFVSVHTNTLDHPSALQLYQKMGFSPVGVGEETVEVWD